MKKLNIPQSAKISWNTIDDNEMERDDQESIFLSTFDDLLLGENAKYQIDYSFYNRGKYEAEPKFILNVYTCAIDRENYSDTIIHLDKSYNFIDDAIEDINYWLSVFDVKYGSKNLNSQTKK